HVNFPCLLGRLSGPASNSTVTFAYFSHNAAATAISTLSLHDALPIFGPGETAKNIAVPIIDRVGSAPSRTFTLTLSSPTNATVVDGKSVRMNCSNVATADAASRLSAPPDVVVGEADGFVDLPVTLSAP